MQRAGGIIPFEAVQQLVTFTLRADNDRLQLSRNSQGALHGGNTRGGSQAEMGKIVPDPVYADTLVRHRFFSQR
ncbi:MAG TPA: hypothetical protein GXX42_10635 [Petrimonas sp.]|nr:hypothetical protein [Petrimonas sp.]HHV86249.1 hypothetical protein [Petrimonas sp.]